jgi:glycosyltransferase involved in cell wall biosynthesis
MWIGVAARLLGAKVVYDSHELWPDRNQRPEFRPWLLAGEALFVRAANRVITTSPGYAAVMAKRYRIREPDLVRNVPQNSVTRQSDPPASPVAVYVGGLLEGRGLEQSIAALSAVPGLTLRMIGPGSAAYRARLAALADSLGVRDRLELVEPVAPSQVVRAVAAASFGVVLIQPVCRSYELTLPNKLLECVAAGLPVLASDLPVIAAFVRSHAVGVVVAPNDAADLASGMAALMDPAFNRECRRRAAALAGELTWGAESRRLVDVYLGR